MVQKITNFKGKIKFNKKYPDGVKERKLDTSILNKFGWKPKINLKNGLKDYYDYFKKNPYNQSNYTPFFSIVTPVYNGEKYLEQTIKSVIGQTITDYEYIIVDNLSKDNSRKIIERYSSKIDKIIFEKDEGMYDALNKGFSNCKGKYLYWINSDDYLFNKDVLMNLKNY